MRPTDIELVHVLRYLDSQFVLADGDRIDGEMIAEALALGPDAPGSGWSVEPGELERARAFAPEFTGDQWWWLRDRADHVRVVHYHLPRRYAREGACVCSRDLLSRVSCRCRYRSV